MTTSAPKMRTVCQLTGQFAGPGGTSAFFKALAESDRRITDAESMAAELERLREENRALKAELDALRDGLAAGVTNGGRK